jgi:hypothetical protein
MSGKMQGGSHTRGTPTLISFLAHSPAWTGSMHNFPSIQPQSEKPEQYSQTFTLGEQSSQSPPSSAAHRQSACPSPSRLHQYPRTCPNQQRPRIRIAYTRPRGLRIFNLFKSWLPIISYVATSLGFVLAIALYREQVFARKSGYGRRWIRIK